MSGTPTGCHSRPLGRLRSVRSLLCHCVPTLPMVVQIRTAASVCDAGTLICIAECATQFAENEHGIRCGSTRALDANWDRCVPLRGSCCRGFPGSSGHWRTHLARSRTPPRSRCSSHLSAKLAPLARADRGVSNAWSFENRPAFWAPGPRPVLMSRSYGA